MEKKIEVSLNMVLYHYLADYAPAIEIDREDVVLKSTDDILRDLNDMVDLEPNDVVITMLKLGYHSEFKSDGRHGWLMQPLTKDKGLNAP